MSINFVPTTLFIKVKQDDQVKEQAVAAAVAGETGLAYILHPPSQGVQSITITHLFSQTRIGGDWEVSTEAEARAWIGKLDEIIDWTGPLPRARADQLVKILHLACIGALHETGEEDAS